MKTYDVKYDIGDEVYILLSKKIIKSRIEKIKIIHASPYVKGETMEQKNGIEIYYLVIVEEKETFTGSTTTKYDWYNQDDIFVNKEEILQKII